MPRKSQYQTLGGSSWRKAQAELHSRGDAYCWRGCGTWLLVDAPRRHPQFMTIGHVTALEDGGSKYDPNNIMPECKPCNYSDGARRTNRKLGNPHRERGGIQAPTAHVDTRWYELYQVGRAMVFDPTLTRAGCPICGGKVPETRTYCTSECRTEYRRRTSRARGDRKSGRIPRDLTIPSTFKSLILLGA